MELIIIIVIGIILFMISPKFLLTIIAVVIGAALGFGIGFIIKVIVTIPLNEAALLLTIILIVEESPILTIINVICDIIWIGCTIVGGILGALLVND